MRSWLAALFALLLSGCVELTADGSVAHVNQETQPDPGIRLHVEFARDTSDGDVFELRAWAENRSPKTFGVADLCDEPWRLSVGRGGQEIQHQEPVARCAALGKGPYRPGNNLSFEARWDGREWDPDEARLREAPEGTYTVKLAFWFYPDDRTDTENAWCCSREVGETFTAAKA